MADTQDNKDMFPCKQMPTTKSYVKGYDAIKWNKGPKKKTK